MGFLSWIRSNKEPQSTNVLANAIPLPDSNDSYIKDGYVIELHPFGTSGLRHVYHLSEIAEKTPGVFSKGKHLGYWSIAGTREDAYLLACERIQGILLKEGGVE